MFFAIDYLNISRSEGESMKYFINTLFFGRMTCL